MALMSPAKPGQYTATLALSRHFVVPRWPSCRPASTSAFKREGMKMRSPTVRSPSVIDNWDLMLRGGPLDIQGGARFFPPCVNILFLPASNGKLFFSKDTYNQTSFFWRHIKSNILFFITIHML